MFPIIAVIGMALVAGILYMNYKYIVDSAPDIILSDVDFTATKSNKVVRIKYSDVTFVDVKGEVLVATAGQYRQPQDPTVRIVVTYKVGNNDSKLNVNLDSLIERVPEIPLKKNKYESLGVSYDTLAAFLKNIPSEKVSPNLSELMSNKNIGFEKVSGVPESKVFKLYIGRSFKAN